MVNTMKIELTPEQSKKIIEDEVIEIKSEDGLSLYFELDGKRFNYCEMDLGADKDKGTKRNTICFDFEDIQKIVPKEPYYGFGNKPQCPNVHCDVSLIYEFNYCPECGQAIKWGK